MGEYNGKINVSKDTMLFVTNKVCKQKIKESTTKENILKLIPEIYEKTSQKEILKMLPYESYLALEDLIKCDFKTSKEISDFIFDSSHKDVRYLEEAMIIVLRVKHREYKYSINPGVLDKLNKLFSKENRDIAKRYGKIEKLTKGMLYSYGVVEFDFLRKQISKYMNEIISEKELCEIYFKRLNLNLDVNYYDVKWTNTNQIQTFVTYIDEELFDVGYIVDEQKSRGLKYKVFKEQDIINREEYLWDIRAKELYKYIKSKNNDVWDFQVQRILKKDELGLKTLEDLINLLQFDKDEEVDEFLKMYMEWYNNSPKYILCGYSPIELEKNIES